MGIECRRLLFQGEKTLLDLVKLRGEETVVEVSKPTNNTSLLGYNQTKNSSSQAQRLYVGAVRDGLTRKCLSTSLHEHPWVVTVGNETPFPLFRNEQLKGVHGVTWTSTCGSSRHERRQRKGVVPVKRRRLCEHSVRVKICRVTPNPPKLKTHLVG